jgi:hypothetical protein
MVIEFINLLAQAQLDLIREEILMAHFAQIDENFKVLQVIVVGNDDIIDNGIESEIKGIAFCKTILGENTNWVQTSYNANFRKNYASIGFIYDVNRDAFIPPAPYPSWILDEETCGWQPPVAKPDGTELIGWAWNEETVSWQSFDKVVE